MWDTLLQVVALDDVVGLVEYSAAIALAVAVSTGSRLHFGSILLPIAVNLGILGLGSLFGFFLKLLLKKRSTDNRLIGLCLPALRLLRHLRLPGRIAASWLHGHGDCLHQPDGG